jgi:hypothetical protein
MILLGQLIYPLVVLFQLIRLRNFHIIYINEKFDTLIYVRMNTILTLFDTIRFDISNLSYKDDAIDFIRFNYNHSY